LKKKEDELSDCLQDSGNLSKQNVADMKKYITARYPAVPVELAQIIAEQTNTLSAKHHIAFPLAVGLMEVESGFNPFAESKVGAVGLLQVMPSVWSKTFHIKDPRQLHGIKKGIDCGLSILQRYIAKNHGNITTALKNYNGTKGDDFHQSVYADVGHFTSFRMNAYDKESDDKDLASKD
jgi:soluble lytic murein transglycosylase-like protein